MRKAMAVGLAAMMVAAMPGGALAAGTTVPLPVTGAISGVARSASGLSLFRATVRVRSAIAGNVVAELQTGAGGSFSAPGLRPGNYVVEAVGTTGRVIGVSRMISVVSGSTSTASITAVNEAGGAAAASPAPPPPSGAMLALIIGGVAAATITTVAVLNNDDDTASPSR